MFLCVSPPTSHSLKSMEKILTNKEANKKVVLNKKEIHSPTKKQNLRSEQARPGSDQQIGTSLRIEVLSTSPPANFSQGPIGHALGAKASGKGTNSQPLPGRKNSGTRQPTGLSYRS